MFGVRGEGGGRGDVFTDIYGLCFGLGNWLFEGACMHVIVRAH
jgi:hypothetical protein